MINNEENIFKIFIKKFTNESFFKDLINISLYPSDFNITISSDSESGNIQNHLFSFFTDLNKVCDRLDINEKKTIKQYTNLLNTILTIRGAGKGVINYDNIFQHITPNNIYLQKIINDVIDNRLKDTNSFRSKIDDLLLQIDYFYDLSLAVSGMNQISSLQDSINNPDVSVVEALSKYKEMALQIYNDLSKLQSLSKEESSTDYFMISDDDSITGISKNVVDYIADGYSSFKTGMSLLDDNMDGMESSSVHMFVAPTNQGKSVVLSNLFRNLIIKNIDDFDDGDACLIVTLEDDITKLLRRLICIFGNYEFNTVKKLYKKSFEIINQEKKKLKNGGENNLAVIRSKIEKIFTQLLNESLYKETKKKVKIIIKHSAENTYTPGDIARYIEKMKVQGVNIKAIVCDYLDVMQSTIQQTYFVERDILGQVTQECRNLSRIYGIPFVTASQAKQEAENVSNAMKSRDMGDSYKKVRYSDFITNLRMRDDLDLFSEEVKKYVIPDKNINDSTTNPYAASYRDTLISKFIPMEMKITKSKETGKNSYRFCLFCKDNTRIYNTIDEYLNDVQELELNTKKLDDQINNLINSHNTTMLINLEEEKPF